MMNLSFRSPLRKLVVFFRGSRDKWKQKCQESKYELKLLKRRHANLQKNHDRWEQQYRQADRRLCYEDVDLIGLWPVRTSTGDVVDEQPESAITRTGLPRLVISDDGRDLHRGLALFQERHAETSLTLS